VLEAVKADASCFNSKTKFTLENNGAGEYRRALNQQTTEGTKK
jgi:hypothetical protein